MYQIYVDGLLLPVTPSKLQIKIGNKNKTINLINEGEVNIIKAAGLTEVAFDALLPNVPYPFAQSTRLSDYYAKRFRQLKTGERKFRFIVARVTPAGTLDDTNLWTSLEDFQIKEDAAAYGLDLMASFKLKQYRLYGTKTVTLKPQAQGKVLASGVGSGRDTKAPPKTYTVQPNDGFWLIAQKTLGSGSRMHEVASCNGMTINSMIHPGDVLKIPAK